MKRLLYIFSAFIVSVLTFYPSFAQQQDDEVFPLYDPTPRTAYARHIQLPEKYVEVILDCVNKYVGNVCADKSEEWWHHQGPFLTFDSFKNDPNRFGLTILPRNDIYKYQFYTYVGKYLLLSGCQEFEIYVDNGEPYEINYIICIHTDEPIYWDFEEKGDTLQLIEQQTSHCPACRWIK